MKILFISFFDPFIAETGPAIHLRGISKALSELGCEVHIIVLTSKNISCHTSEVKLHYCNSNVDLILEKPIVKNYAVPMIFFKEISRVIKEYKIDIVHGQSPSSFFYGLLRDKNIPYVVTLHSISFGELESYFKIPLSFVDKNTFFEVLGDILVTPLLQIECKCADRVITVSDALAKDAVRFLHLSHERIVSIHNGIDLQSLNDFLVPNARSNHTILSTGRLVWRKGYKYLLDAMRKVLLEYPDSKLLIVGQGEQKKLLQLYAKKLQIDKSVVFMGGITRKNLFSLYSTAHVYVQPSIYEPFGITLLEAMSMKTPVVATNVGGIPEIITNGIDGLLVEPRNSLQLANAIIRIFSDSSLSKTLGNNARMKVEKKFTWTAIAKKTIMLYKDLLEKKLAS